MASFILIIIIKMFPWNSLRSLPEKSLAEFNRDFQKSFGQAPQQWLSEKILAKELNRIVNKNIKPLGIYLERTFHSLSHSFLFLKKVRKAPIRSVATS